MRTSGHKAALTAVIGAVALAAVALLATSGSAASSAGSAASSVTEGSATPIKLKRQISGSVTPLGRTVELTFRLKSQDPQTITVTSATTRYGVEVRFAGANAAANIEIGGDLLLMPPGDKTSRERLLVTCQSFIGYDANETIDSYVVSSAVVEFGKEMPLIKYGELTMTVEAAIVN